jgi:hypothetical protein
MQLVLYNFSHRIEVVLDGGEILVQSSSSLRLIPESTNGTLGVGLMEDVLDLESFDGVGGSTILLELELNRSFSLDDTISSSLGSGFTVSSGSTLSGLIKSDGVASEAGNLKILDVRTISVPVSNSTGDITSSTDSSSVGESRRSSNTSNSSWGLESKSRTSVFSLHFGDP